MTAAQDFYSQHRERLETAIETTLSRAHWTPFIESPSRKLHPKDAKAQGLAAFEARLGQAFEDTCVATDQWPRQDCEQSPYTQRSLGIQYAAPGVEALLAAGRAAQARWAECPPEQRLGVCLEILDRWASQVFENAFATMHTCGQGFMLAFAGSGANSLDRGLEALAYAAKAMRDIPSEALFQRRFGASEVRLHKRYRLRPRGLAVVVTCASYPAWNAYPAIFANLATGNPVLVKPHPTSVLTMAMAVRCARQTLRDAGFDPNLIQLAVDTVEAPVTKALIAAPSVAIVDFTGSPGFGQWIERNSRGKLTYTETAGCNAVLCESTNHYQEHLFALAQSLCFFSSQMCTAPQNIYIPEEGMETDQGLVSVSQWCEDLQTQIDAITDDPKLASALCGCLQSAGTAEAMARLERAQASRVLRSGRPYQSLDAPEARTATPLLLTADIEQRGLFGREHFGPIAFVIRAQDRDQALAVAADDARLHGSIAAYAYSRDEAYLESVERAYFEAGASIGLNLHWQRPINFTAAFSDYHVTGLNPAGNACLTDLAFVSQRFRVVQSKREQEP